MQRWEYLLLAVSINAWQKPAPAVAVIDGSGQITQHTFLAFHTYVNGLGEQGWQLAHVQDTAGSSAQLIQVAKSRLGIMLSLNTL